MAKSIWTRLAFNGLVAAGLALAVGVLQRKAHTPRLREAGGDDGVVTDLASRAEGDAGSGADQSGARTGAPVDEPRAIERTPRPAPKVSAVLKGSAPHRPVLRLKGY